MKGDRGLYFVVFVSFGFVLSTFLVANNTNFSLFASKTAEGVGGLNG